MLGILFFLAPVQQDHNLFLISFVVIAGCFFFFLVNNNICFLFLVLGKLYVNLFSCTEMYVSDSVEAAQSFSLRLRKLLLNLLGCCLEHVLCMGTYSRVNAR